VVCPDVGPSVVHLVVSMKTLVLSVIMALCAGCSSLMPKAVEFGQDKVARYPEISAKQTEVLKQTAWKASELAREVHIGAVQENVSTNLVVKAEDTSLLTESVSDALGPPRRQPAEDATARELVASLEHRIALYAADVQDFKDEIAPLAGKKVEGTGWFQVPYLLWIGGIAVAAWLVYTFGKVGLSVAALAHPAAGMGLAAVNLTGSLAGKMIKQLAVGGERFKEALGKLNLDEKVREIVLNTFRAEHESVQDEDTQVVVKELTNKG